LAPQAHIIRKQVYEPINLYLYCSAILKAKPLSFLYR
jgi:hypothetical protein